MSSCLPSQGIVDRGQHPGKRDAGVVCADSVLSVHSWSNLHKVLRKDHSKRNLPHMTRQGAAGTLPDSYRAKRTKWETQHTVAAARLHCTPPVRSDLIVEVARAVHEPRDENEGRVDSTSFLDHTVRRLQGNA